MQSEDTRIYDEVAKTFCDRINAAFDTEATLETEFKKNYEQLPFSRTDFWQGIIYGIMREAWYESGPGVKTEPTGFDRLAILKASHPLLDYNLYSQVLLNLQTYNGMAYQSGDAEKEIARLKEAWPKDAKLDPFASKAKMVKQAEVATEEQKNYNTAVSSLKALRIIAQFSPQISFRVSPKGKTPALADSMNLSMLGVGADRYLKVLPELAVWYLAWPNAPPMACYAPSDPPNPKGIEFHAEGIPYPFFSKSGGDILQTVLFARKLIYEVVRDVDITQENCTMIPRMNSILVVADKYGTSLKKTVERLKAQYQMIELTEGSRFLGGA
jgi:hypothetical protein